MQNLPIGISSFEKIREEGYLYIDKTPYIHQLISTGIYYFLSRPRRFGKSLLVSTLRCLFEARQELFCGLYIDDKWDWTEKYPVLAVDFNILPSDTEEMLHQSLDEMLEKTAKEEAIDLNSKIMPRRFQELILKLSQKYNQDVAILIDEYDKPIINHLGLGEGRLTIAKKNRELLKGFFGVIKDNEVSAHTKFVLLTGVSKFSQVSIFSELNNLDDITMSKATSAILGITEDEVNEYLNLYIEDFAQHNDISLSQLREQLKSYYNGYCFASQTDTIYNPFSLFRCLKEKEIRNYWFETGTPTFLANLIKEKDYYIPKTENIDASREDFSTYDLEHLQLNALLFQSGYLTIKDVDEDIFTLGYPNLEVKKSFNRYLFTDYTQRQDTVIFSKIDRALRKQDLNTCIDLIKSLFAGIPYSISSKQDESYFHTLFYLMLSGSGIFVETEVLTSDGRIDLIAHYPDTIYIFEFKCNQTAQKAIEQIKQKNYPQKYKHIDKPILLVGVDFSLETKNVKEWVYENG